ncbi:hypothetical protein [Novosphingobium sp. 9]|nr:hypothetical protein [Novosphingobium sp. 9]
MPEPDRKIRLRLVTGHHVIFDNMIDLFDFVVERMIARGDL